VTEQLEAATTIGVLPQALPQADGGWTSDGDAYTLAAVTQPVPTGKPVLTSLDPTEFVIGSESVALHCHGTGFTRDCFIAFAGHAERTDYHDDTDVSTFIDSAVWVGADVVQVAVVSETRGGSESLDFAITAP
jgi:hypothetical protein